MQFVPEVVQCLVQAHLRGLRTVAVFEFGIVCVVWTQEHLADAIERSAAQRESVKVVVVPAEGRLQNLMQDVQRHFGTQVEPTPDGRPGIIEVDPDAEDRQLGSRSPTQVGSRACTEHVATVTHARPRAYAPYP